MNDQMRDRSYCLSLLHEFTKSESLRKHAYAVEICVRAYAIKFSEDVDYWGNVALLHDFDYEKFPTESEHPFKGAEILRLKGFDENFINAILSHADYTKVPRESLLKKTLFACDELAGFITACAYVRPNRTVDEVEVKSVLKKLKDKAFARAVNRDDIYNGANELGVELTDHIQFCIDAMRENKTQIDL